ncbi:unnamed protein product [Ixodes hexagonus]
MEPNQQRGRGARSGRRPPRGGSFGQSSGRGGLTQGVSSESACQGNRGSRNFRKRSRRVQRDTRHSASSAEVSSAAGYSIGLHAGERLLLTGDENVEGAEGVEGRTEGHQSGVESLPTPFAFPSFEQITTGSRSNGIACNNVFELAECALVDHIHNCFREAVRKKVSVSLGDLRVVPQRGLGRTVSATVGHWLQQGIIGSTIALLDMTEQTAYYGEIVQVEKEQVFLFHSEEVLDTQPGHAFTVVDVSLSTSFFSELLSVLASRNESSLLRKLWLGAGESTDEARPSSTTTLQRPKAPAVLDQSQTEAFCAGVSEQVALIHAPSGCGTKRLLKALIDYFWVHEHAPTKQPMLIIVQNPLQLQVKLRWTPEDVFNMDGEEMDKLTKAAQQSSQAVLALGEVKATLFKVHNLLLQLYEAETSILHQSSFEGITLAFSLERNKKENLIEVWLLGDMKHEQLKGSISKRKLKQFQEHCKRYPVKKVDAAGPSSEDICFSFDRNSQAHSGPPQQTIIPTDKNSFKAAYVWKTLMGTHPNADLTSIRDIHQLEMVDRWRLYKHWAVLFCKMKQKNLRETSQHLAVSIERYRQVLMEARACLKLSQPVIMASPATAITHRSVLEILKPRVTILCDATEIEDFCLPALLTQSTEKVIFMGDTLNPRHAPSSCWMRLLKSGNFRVHELAFQYFQSQEVCDLLLPFLDCQLVSRATPQRVNGVRETVQFFSIPDIREAAFMVARLCIHLQVHNYEPSDVAVLTLSPWPGPIKTLKQAFQQLGCVYGVCLAKAFYPRRCKIAVILLGPGSHGTELAVALSRVCFAVYVFGDFSKGDESCQNILNTAKASNEDLFRGSLNLTCICHPEKVIFVASRQDFETKLDVDGSCLAHSSSILPCGHTREVMDPEGHQGIAPCQQPCRKTICKRGHRCPNKCSDPCSRLCTQLSTGRLPSCGHDATLQCHQLDTVLEAQKRLLDVTGSSTVETQPHVPYKCTVKITKKRPCGHLLKTRCCDSLSSQCRKLRQKTLPKCGHTARLACYMWDDSAILARHECTETVTVKAPCGHPASLPCHKLNLWIEGQPHLPAWHKCTHEAMKKAPCGHLVKAKCFESPSSPCQECVNTGWEPYEQYGMQATGSIGEDSSRSHKAQSFHRGAITKRLPCGHPVSVEPYNLGEPAMFECKVPVPVMRRCGHILRVACSVSHRASNFPPCYEIVEEPRACGHNARRRCSDRGPIVTLCQVAVRETLACGHPLSRPCWSTSRECLVCDAIVEKVLPCGHTVSRPRYDNSPCSLHCSVHLSCGHLCVRPCDGHVKQECLSCKDKCCVS